MFDKLKSIIAEQFAVSEDVIDMDTSFVDDLGADSLDAVELIMAVEEAFDIPEADEEQIARFLTVGDLAKYITSNFD
ncbi:MAG: acyl carrier protein [Oscillospiraceae bacterium]|nr:acyl carrier protein [Oscillospiraceae bacterium]